MYLICFSDIFWDYLWQRHQNILVRFPKDWNIIFIEPTSLLTLIKEPKRIFSRKLENITIVSLPSLPLLDRISTFRCINDTIILFWIKAISKMNGITFPILMYYEPRYATLIGRLNEKLVVYECVDDRLAFSSVPRWIETYINILINKSDIIITTSLNLLKIISEKRTKDVYLIGNGVDVKFFNKAMTNLPVPEDIKCINSPIAGYIGAIDEWLDFNLLKAIAINRPDISIVLLGPVNSKVNRSVDALKKLHNIFVIGKRSYFSLPNYIKAFDICLIPFKLNRLTQSVDPVKLYEYLAGGKNVISTELPELIQYENIIYVAKNESEFINLIDLALTKDLNLEDASIVLSDKTWETKSKKISDLMLSYLCKEKK